MSVPSPQRAYLLGETVQVHWLSRVEFDKVAWKVQRGVGATLEPGRKLLDLLRIVMPSVTRATCVPVEQNRQRSPAVELHQPMLRE